MYRGFIELCSKSLHDGTGADVPASVCSHFKRERPVCIFHSNLTRYIIAEFGNCYFMPRARSDQYI